VSFGRQNAGTTPFLAEMASSGTTFLDARAPSSWTPPSMASIMTGLYPKSHGVTYGILKSHGLVYQPTLSPALATLAEGMKQAGYVTIGVPSNLHLSKTAGFGQGFDYFYGEAHFLSAIAVNLKARQLLREAFGMSWKKGSRERPERSCFLWLHYFDPHDPYGATPPFIKRIDPSYSRSDDHYPRNKVMSAIKAQNPTIDATLASCLRPLYESEVAYVDDRIRSFSEDLGLEDDDVLLVVTADHGEEFADHGGLGHAHTLYDELLRVPLFMRWRGHLPAGLRIEGPASIIDIYPTILDLLQIKAPAGLQGESLLPRVLHHEMDTRRRPIFASLHTPKPELRSVVKGRYKLISNQNTGAAHLFDLDSDPGEQNDISASAPKARRALTALLDRWNASLPPPPALHRIRIDDETRKRLESMGYGGE